MGVRPHCSQVQSHVLAESLDNIPQVHAARYHRRGKQVFSLAKDFIEMW